MPFLAAEFFWEDAALWVGCDSESTSLILFVEAVGVDRPQRLGVVQELPEVDEYEQGHRQHQSIQILPEHPMGFEVRPVLLEHWGHDASTCELVDREPVSLDVVPG
jgi:hypothetical protein